MPAPAGDPEATTEQARQARCVSPTERSDRSHDWIGRGLSIGSVLLLVAIAATLFIYGDQVSGLRRELNAMGARGVVALIVLEVIWTLTTVPSIPLMSLAGVLYGPWKGTLYVLIGGSIGVSLTFWLGRTLLRDRVRQWCDRYEKLAKMMTFVEKHSALSVLIVRLAPVFPLNLLNYGFGATRTPFSTYFLASLLAFIPGAALYAGLGEVLWRTLVGKKGMSLEIWIWVASFLVLTAGLSYWAASLHRRASENDE